jgi:glycosyltransferase involved in cell wall biosynthesis
LLKFKADEWVITHAPRGMPFGRDFGEKLLSSLVNAFIKLRKKYPTLRLVLTGIRDERELRFPGMPDNPKRVKGLDVRDVLPPKQIRALTASADIVVAEGTTTAFEAIAAGTPLLMVPGTIYETWLLGTRLYEADAARIEWSERVSPNSIAGHLDHILSDPERTRRRVERAKKFLGRAQHS